LRRRDLGGENPLADRGPLVAVHDALRHDARLDAVVDLNASSSFFWNVSYALGTSSSGTWCVAKSSMPSGSASRQTSGRMSPTQRRTLAWPIRRLICLSNIWISGIGLAAPP
jgi:hypothetical protein